MSQYIPGVIDYVPQIQPYKPDLNFYQRVLETKNAQYKEGYNKLSSLYGQLLESPMLRTENVELRNKFFNDIGNQIKKISTMDLSMPQNVEAASKVFQPLIDNKYILKDMAYTQRAYSALEKGQRLKDDPESQGQYWEGGIRAIQYQMSDFAKSTADESLGFNSPDYTPFVNIPEKAMKFAKDMGFNTSYVSFSPDGKYQIITKNGVQMIPELTNAFLAVFKNDQTAIDYYKTLSTLNRRDYMAQNAGEFGSEEAAEKNYLSNLSQQLRQQFGQQAGNAQKELNAVETREKATDAIIAGRGVNTNDDKDLSLVKVKQQSSVEKLIAMSSKDFYEKSAETISDQILLSSGLNAERSRIDSAVANNLFVTDLYNSAVSYAMNTAEIKDIKADQYALASFENQLATNKMVLEYGLKYDYDKKKAALDILTDKLKGEGSAYSYTPGGNNINVKAPQEGGGGAAVVEDLFKVETGAVSTTGEGLTNAIAAKAKAVNQVLMTFQNAKAGQTLNGVIIKDEAQARAIRDYARQKQVELFGVAEETTTSSNSKSLFSSPFAAFQFLNFFADDETTTKTNYSGGYLKENGELIEFNQAPYYRDGKNKNNWYYLNEKLKAAESDPVLSTLIRGNAEVAATSGAIKNAETTYYSQKKIQTDNNKTVLSAALSNPQSGFASALSNAYSPEYARKFTSQNFIKANGDVISKKEFANAYANGHPAVKKPKTWTETDEFGVTIQVPVDPGTYSKEDYKDDAEDLYDEMFSSFIKIYNQGPNATIGTQGMKSVKYSYTVGGEGGAGVQAGAAGYDMIDAAFPMDLGAQDFLSFMNIAQSADASGALIGIVNADGGSLNSKVLNDLDDEKLKDAGLFDILKSVQSTMLKGVKNTDAERPTFSFYHHPIIGNDASKMGFTITLDPGYVADKKGGKNTPGLTANMTSPSITLILDANKVNKQDLNRLNVVGVLERGIEDLQMEANDVVNIDEYADYAGTASIEKVGDRFRVTTNLKGFDQNGKPTYTTNTTMAAEGATASSISKVIRAQLPNLYEKNYIISEQLRQLQPLEYDPNAFTNK
jgi:hypothetical protein